MAASATARVRVVAAPAVSVDVVNIPERGRAGVDFELVVRALDQFGNVDEAFERDVTLDCDGPGFELPNGGVVNLARGMATLRVLRSDQVEGPPKPSSQPIGNDAGVVGPTDVQR